MPGGGVAFAGGARADHQLVGAIAMGHDRLGAVQHPALAVMRRRGEHVGQVVAGLALAMCEREFQFALGDLRQQRLLLRGGARQADRRTGQHHCGDVRFDHQRAAELFHDQHGLDRSAAEAAILFSERQPEQAEFGELRPQRRAPAVRLLQVALARLEAVVVRHQAGDAVGQQPLVVGEIEIHYSLSTAFVRMFFWISFVPP